MCVCMQVAMERQFDRRPRHSGGAEPDTWSHDRWATRGGSAGGYDRWSSGASYGAYNGVFAPAVPFVVILFAPMSCTAPTPPHSPIPAPKDRI